MRLGSAIRVARARKGLRQAELARRLDVSATYISLLERDRRDPSWSFVNRLADALDVPLPVLLLLASPADDRELPRSTLRAVLGHELLGLLAEPD